MTDEEKTKRIMTAIRLLRGIEIYFSKKNWMHESEFREMLTECQKEDNPVNE